MPKVSLGKAIPDFKGRITNELIIKFSDYKGQNIVIYFYPKDNTPGCTKEGEDFRDYFEDFKKNNKEVTEKKNIRIAKNTRLKKLQEFL